MYLACELFTGMADAIKDLQLLTSKPKDPKPKPRLKTDNIALYRDNGKENGNYFIIIGVILGLYSVCKPHVEPPFPCHVPFALSPSFEEILVQLYLV